MTMMRRMNRTEGDNKEGDKTQEDCEMSNATENVSCEEASNEQKSGGKSKIRDDNVMTEVVPMDDPIKRGGGEKVEIWEVCQNIITKWTCQFMDLTDKAMIVVSSLGF